MSRYLLLFLLNLPFILAGLLGALVNYKMKRISKRRYLAQSFIWGALLVGLALAQTIYEWLFTHNLTQTEPLSLFDVIQITAIVTVFYMANRSRAKIETLEKRVQDLHQELSIQLTDKE